MTSYKPFVKNLPEAALEYTPCPPNTALISITEPGRQAPLSNNFVSAEIFRLAFDDIDKPEINRAIYGNLRGRKLEWFTPTQAGLLAAFLISNRGKNLIVHCAAGISRSGAVVDVILEAFPEYRDEGWPRYANGHVKSLLKRAMGMTPIGVEP